DLELTQPESSATARTMATAERANPWFWQPAQGLHRSPDGRTYPLFARKAVGCTITDLEGREFLDYIMGWGCTLLGYAHPAIQQVGFAATGIPDRAEPLIHRFAFNNVADVQRLLEAHKGEVAAVMLEPAAPAEGIQGPVADVDRTFLREVAELTRRHGALLIF